MDIVKALFANISLLVTLTCLLNVSYKMFFAKLSPGLQYITTILWYTLAGGLTMFFNFDIGDARFDLRYVPIIFGILVFPSAAGLFLIGLAIGILRFAFSTDAAAWAGFTNLIIIGFAAACLSEWFSRRRDWSYLSKVVVAVLSINALNVVDRAVFGVFPWRQYLSELAPVVFTVSSALSFFFFLIIRDLEQESIRIKELSQTNRLLRARTNEFDSAKRELERKNVQLEAASQYKSEFLTHMSHELNAPLNHILQLSQMQADSGTDDKDRQRYSEIIHQSGEDLLGLVNDILDLSKMEAGKLETVRERVPTGDILQILEEEFRPAAERRGLEFRTFRSANCPDWLETDPYRLSQLLRNLLAHTFHFADHDRVELIISGRGAAGGSVEAVFQVRGTRGMGEHSGVAALRLVLSRQLAQLLGGKIDEESGAGEGGGFTLSLPVRAPET